MASMLATMRAMICGRTSSADSSLLPANRCSADVTSASLWSSAGSAAVEALAGDTCACTIGCWIGAIALPVVAGAVVAEAGGADCLTCMAL